MNQQESAATGGRRMNRRAPKGGYEKSGAKGHYRRQIWRRFHDHCGSQRHSTHCLLMPSREGYEIEIALQNGFREERLHIVDDNPAIIAQHKRRYPRIHTYGVDIVRACERMANARYVIGVANFDLTSNISNSSMGTFERLAIAWQAIFDAESLFAFTVLRGREQRWQETTEPALRMGLGRLASDWTRLFAALMAMNIGPARVAASDEGNGRLLWAVPVDRASVGIYRSTAGTQTMLWCMCRFLLRTVNQRGDGHAIDEAFQAFGQGSGVSEVDLQSSDRVVDTVTTR